MANRKEARQAVADDLRALADDLKALLEDPKTRKRNERRWKALYGVIALATTLTSRKLAARAWGILTGEQPPSKAATARSATFSRPQDRSETPTAV
jgi:hypothetical protein